METLDLVSTQLAAELHLVNGILRIGMHFFAEKGCHPFIYTKRIMFVPNPEQTCEMLFISFVSNERNRKSVNVGELRKKNAKKKASL